MTSLDVSRLTVRLGAYRIKQGREPNSLDFPVSRVVRHRNFDMRTLVNCIFFRLLKKIYNTYVINYLVFSVQ